MRSFNLFILASAISAGPILAINTYTIEEAAKKGLVKLTIKGKGGYTGNVIEMKIQNITNEPLSIKVEAGRRLDSKDDTQQDILVTRSQELFVSAKQSKLFNIFGMCCQAHNAGPEQNSVYTVGKLADTNLVKLAQFIDKNNYSSDHTAQQAVWTVSDNNSLASIVDGEKETVIKFRNYVSQITGRPIPTYNVSYRQENDRDVLGHVNKIEGVLNYSLNIPTIITVAIYNSAGKVVQTIFENQNHDKGDYKVFYIFKTQKLPEGIYYARTIVEGAVLKEEKIEF